MANHKRKRSKRQVKCTMCTQDRWKGNAKGRFKPKEESKRKSTRNAVEDAISKSKDPNSRWE